MSHLLEKEANKLGDKIEYDPSDRWKMGHETGLMEGIKTLESLYGRMISIEDLKQILAQVYEEKSKGYDDPSVQTGMHTAYLDIAPIIESILKKAEELVAERAKQIEEENGRIGRKRDENL